MQNELGGVGKISVLMDTPYCMNNQNAPAVSDG